MTANELPSYSTLSQEAPARLQTLDILRGLALMGIFIVHCVTGFSGWMFASPEKRAALPLASINPIIGDIINFLMTDKSRTLFAFMFGVSFFLQLQSAEQHNQPFRWSFLRRLTVLMIFGLIHGHLLYGGDILRYYAAGGVLLLLAYRWPSKWLVITGLVLSVGVPFATDIVVQMNKINLFAGFPPLSTIHEGYLSQSFLDNLWINHLSAVWRYHWFFLLYFAVPSTGIFLFGVWMARRRYLQQAQQHRQMLRVLCIWGLAIGFLLQSANLMLNNLIGQQVIAYTQTLSLILGLLSYTAPLLVALGYVCGLTLLCMRTGWVQRLSVLAPAGRMTLTNYVVQSALGWIVFNGSGLGLYMRVGPALSLIIALVLCAVQLAYSAWWLRHFRMGPLEWALRWAVGGKRPAMWPEVPQAAVAK
jgi:uncharacterized protein